MKNVKNGRKQDVQSIYGLFLVRADYYLIFCNNTVGKRFDSRRKLPLYFTCQN